MRIPRPNLTAVALTVATFALVVIAAGSVYGIVSAELQRREYSAITASMESSDAMVPIETTVTVLDVSQHVSGEPGEEVTIELSPGVWEVLGGGTDDDPVTLASLVHPITTTWTGFRNVISVLPLDEAEHAMDERGVMPEGPMTLSVATDAAWVVDFRRQVCPGDYASS